MTEFGLASTQGWFAAAITTGECVEHGVAHAARRWSAGAEEIVTPGPRTSAMHRLDVYHRAYRARLVECLTDDYPALLRALGEKTFERVCHEYIALHTSRSFSLNFYGSFMSAFCAEQSESWSGFASDLAALEWAMVEVIHAPTLPRSDTSALARIAPDEWSARSLVPNTALRIVRARYPVNSYYQAFREGSEREEPPAPRATVVAVSRADMTVWRTGIAAPLVPVLDALVAGATLGDALAAAHGSEAEIASSFRDWMSTGIFVGVS